MGRELTFGNYSRKKIKLNYFDVGEALENSVAQHERNVDKSHSNTILFQPLSCLRDAQKNKRTKNTVAPKLNSFLMGFNLSVLM
jgi:hypothetical protein